MCGMGREKECVCGFCVYRMNGYGLTWTVIMLHTYLVLMSVRRFFFFYRRQCGLHREKPDDKMAQTVRRVDKMQIIMRKRWL